MIFRFLNRPALIFKKKCKGLEWHDGDILILMFKYSFLSKLSLDFFILQPMMCQLQP